VIETVVVALSESAEPHEGQKQHPSGTWLSQAVQVMAVGVVYSWKRYQADLFGAQD